MCIKFSVKCEIISECTFFTYYRSLKALNHSSNDHCGYFEHKRVRDETFGMGESK